MTTFMPAEWVRHEATFLTWPHRAEIWRGVHEETEQAFAKIAARLTSSEPTYINVPNLEWARRVRDLVLKAGGVGENLRLLPIDSNDVWCRDHGPTVVYETKNGVQRRVFLDWEFNAWGGKFVSDLDNQIPEKLALALGFDRIRPGLVLEGGGIEVNGAGDLLTTESVLLNENRNPDVPQDELERRLKELLGVSNIVWLGDGLTGDDTDGHIDDLSRFVNETTIVSVMPDSESHHDWAPLAENFRRLKDATSAKGKKFDVLPLPMPSPVDFDGELLPASYANFYIANELVLVPVFNDPNDAKALGMLQELFPGRKVEGIDCRAIVSQYGAIHCISQQLPVAP